MGMEAILFNDAEPFQQTDNIPSTKGTKWNLVKIGQAVSEKKKFKDYAFFTHVYSPGARVNNPRGQNFDYN